MNWGHQDMEDKNIKFLEYLQVCGKEHIGEDDFDVIKGNKCDFRRYYELVREYESDFEEIACGYYELVKNIKDSVGDYNKILDITSKMGDVHKKFIDPKGTYESCRRLSCIMDEIALSKGNIVSVWEGLSKLYVGPHKARIGNRFYKMYPKFLKSDEMIAMTFRQEKVKGKNIGAIIYKDSQELIYKLDKETDIIKIADTIKDLNFEYELVALAPCFVDIFYELELYISGNINKELFEKEVIKGI